MNRKNKTTILLAVLLCGLLFSGCTAGAVSSSEDATDSVISQVISDIEEGSADESASSAEKEDFESSAPAGTGTGASPSSEIDLSEGSPTITKSGTYRISGTLKNGSITVNVDKTTDEGTVYLVLNSVNINSDDGTPINIIEAKDVVLVLEDGSENTVTQGAITTTDEDFPSGAIFSKADLAITGSGTLHVTTKYNDGITSRDDLKITDSTIQIEAVNDGIVGKDLLETDNAVITIDCGKDAMRATNETDADKGNLLVSGGSYTLTSGDDGLQAVGNLEITDGTFVINATGDGIHADKDLFIRDGDITIANSNEGLEGANVTIDGGAISIVSADDGINVNDQSGILTVNGGKIQLSCYGDSIDSNGDFTQTGGEIIIDTTATGPGDSAVDYDGTFTGTGGTIVDQDGNTIEHQSGMQGGPGGGMNGRGGRQEPLGEPPSGLSGNAV